MNHRALETKNVVVRDKHGVVIDQFRVRKDAVYLGDNHRVAAVVDAAPDLFEDVEQDDDPEDVEQE